MVFLTENHTKKMRNWPECTSPGCPNRETRFFPRTVGLVWGKFAHTRAPQAAAGVHAPRIMSGDKATARSRELLAVEHNDAGASHPATLLLGGERGAPSPSPSPAKKNGGANEHPANASARTKPDFSKLPPPPSALLAKLNAFMPEMRRANAELEEAMKTRPAGDFDIEHVSGSESDSDSDTDDALEDGTGLDPASDEYKVRAAIRGIEAQQRKDAKTRTKRKGGKQVIEMNVGLGVVDLATEQAVARARELAGDAVVGGDASSEDTRESGGRIRLPGQVDDAGRRAGIQELS